MWYAIFFTILVTVNGTALAQNRPSMTWQGEVTGGATLYIQGNRVDVQGRETGSVDRPTYRFRDMLPAVEQNVEVRVVRGRGRVNIVEQPSQANQHTAIVDIRNNGRPQVYELEFFWRGDNNIISNNRRGRRADDYGYRGRRAENVADAGQVTWAGEVDHEVIVTFRGRQAIATAVRGRDIYNERADFSSPMPRQDMAVQVVDARGRGRVELMDQPHAGNNYTAKVRVLDEEGGASPYSFTLAWNGGYSGSSSGSVSGNQTSGGILSPGGSPNPNDSYGTYGGTGMRWSGRVDGQIRVTVQGNRAWSQRISGGQVYDERISMGAALPRQNFRDVDVRKLQGRGDVEMVQRPSSNNNYTLIFEVEDDDAGADSYEVEVTWR